MLLRDADPNRSVGGLTALSLAADRGSHACVELLLQGRADSKAADAVYPYRV